MWAAHMGSRPPLQLYWAFPTLQDFKNHIGKEMAWAAGYRLLPILLCSWAVGLTIIAPGAKGMQSHPRYVFLGYGYTAGVYILHQIH